MFALWAVIFLIHMKGYRDMERDSTKKLNKYDHLNKA